MTDYISREAAITAIQKAYIDTQEGFDKAAVKINVGLTKALHIMQDLPAADVVEVKKPDHGYMWICPQCGLDVRSDYGGCIRCGYMRDDVVEVIRCKDCKWFGTNGCAVDIVDETDLPTEEEFCAWAERRET